MKFFANFATSDSIMNKPKDKFITSIQGFLVTAAELKFIA